MSNTNIPKEIRYELWFVAAGRCEKCHKKLDYENLSRNKHGKYSEAAHIVSDSPQGPRGDKERSKTLSKNIKNLLLLCASCHKEIDKTENLGFFTEKYLLEMKTTREQEIQDAIDRLEFAPVNLAIYGCKIGASPVPLDEELIDQAIAVEGMRTNEHPIYLNKNNFAMCDNDSAFWDSAKEDLRKRFMQTVTEEIEGGNVRPWLLFAVAPQPLLVYLGVLFGDVTNVITHQLAKKPTSWTWENSSEEDEFVLIPPEGKHGKVVLNISLSAAIEDKRISDAIGSDVSIWRITHKNIGNDFLRTRKQLDEIQTVFRQAYKKIKEYHGHGEPIHVFPAMPVAAAIEFGRTWNTKADQPLILYDMDFKTKQFRHAIDIGLPSIG